MAAASAGLRFRRWAVAGLRVCPLVPRVVIVDTGNLIMRRVADLLRGQGQAAVSVLERDAISEQLEELTRADVLCVFGGVPIGPLVLDAAPNLRGLVSPFTGIEGFDVAAATERGVLIANGQSDENVNSVAEATVMLTLAAAYDLPHRLAAMNCTDWARREDGNRARMLKAMTVGLVGYGRIGQEVARILSVFGCKLLVYAPRLHAALPEGASQAGLSELVQRSDAILLLASLNPQSHHMIDAGLIELMKPDAAIINVARGALIDERALVAAALEGRVGRLVLDVFEQEPISADNPPRNIPGAILTPHCVAHTREALTSLPLLAVENINRLLRGEPPLTLVNPDALSAWRAHGFKR
jgi:phosphoglycerate dehydrogenase-like enzyme